MTRKKDEEALKLSEEQFRRAIEDAPIPIIMQAEDGQVLQLSRTWTELTGYTINDVPDFDTWITKAAYGEGANAVRDHMHTQGNAMGCRSGLLSAQIARHIQGL